MSGLGRLPDVQVPQVQVPNYNGIGALIAQSGINYSGLGSGIAAGMEAMGKQRQQGALNDMEQQKIDIMQQQANQQNQQQQIQQQGMKIDQANKQKEFLADMAYGITRQPADKQEAAYKQVVGGLAQQGVIPATQLPPQWDQGGKDFVHQMAVQSPMAMKSMGMQLAAQKDAADIDLKTAQAAGTRATTALNGGGKPMTGADAKVLTMAADGANQIKQLRDLYPTVANPEVAGYLPNALQSSGVQKIEFLKNNLADQIGHLRAGARISDQVQAKMLSFLPKLGDTTDTVNYKLDQLQSGLQNVAAEIRPNGNLTPGADHQDTGYSAAVNQYPGLTQQQYQSWMQSKNR